MKKIISITFLFSLVLIFSCTSPHLTDTSPNSGIPHTLMENSGDVAFAKTVWKNGIIEKDLTGDFYNARWFTIPYDAKPGMYSVQLSRFNELSPEKENIHVLQDIAHVFPSPTLTFIQSVQVKSRGTDSVDLLLFAQGENIDAGASIIVNNETLKTHLWDAMKNDLHGFDSTAYGHPVFHYSMLFAFVTLKKLETIVVSVKNEDGVISNRKEYMAVDSINWDTDNDGLPDTWEKHGYDADGDGNIDCDLPAMGANPAIVDVFVETDFMNHPDNFPAGRPLIPSGNPWALVENAFKQLPMLNLYPKIQGIQLHIDHGQPLFVDLKGDSFKIPSTEMQGGTILPFFDYIRLDTFPSPCAGPPDGGTWINFFKLKNNDTVLRQGTKNFYKKERNPIFHYCIFANWSGYFQECTSTGRAESPGNDFYISGFNTSLTLSNTFEIASAFMHELGHNLGLKHGGNEDVNRKPDYSSVMNYMYQSNGTDNDCDGNGDGTLSYSKGMSKGLDERDLNERDGICNRQPVDWNGNGVLENSVRCDINGDSAFNLLKDNNDLKQIQFLFRNLSTYDAGF